MLLSTIVGLLSLHQEPELWTATTSFMPQAYGVDSNSRLANLAGQFGVSLETGSQRHTPEFYVDLISSREILRPLASEMYRASDTGTLGQLLGLEEEDPQRRVSSVIGWLREEAMDVTANSRTGVVEIEVTTPWPEVSRQVAERIVELVNTFNLETRQSAAAAERRFVEERLEATEDELRSAEFNLQRFLENNREFGSSPQMQLEHDRLQRQVAMRQQVYTSLLQAYEQARISEVRNTPNISVIEDPETPVRPNGQSLRLRLLLSILIGGGVGITIALTLQYIHVQQEEGSESWAQLQSILEGMSSDFRQITRVFKSDRSGS